jgi:hypothetical protein
MKSTVLWALLGLNAVLLFMFAGQVTHVKSANAQLHRGPDDYLLIPGDVNGQTTAMVYVIDTTHGRLGAIAYNDTNRSIDLMPPIDLNTIYSTAAPARH